MKVVKNEYPNIKPEYDITEYAPIDKILFIDIETTGLNSKTTNLYLIGCGHYTDMGFKSVQFFADNTNEENTILIEFFNYINDKFTCLINFNGKHFDLPYIDYKAQTYSLYNPLNSITNVDLYTIIKPYKKLLSLPNLRQRTIEEFLSINSDDPYTGKELISVYHNYVSNNNDTDFSSLIYHNSEDILGMTKIIDILSYKDIKNTCYTYENHTINDYYDYQGNRKNELLINLKHNAQIPVGFKTIYNSIILITKPSNKAILRIPIIETTLKKFYTDIKNYYFLPLEDTCILKAIALGVDKKYRENAKKETCYTKYSGLFIPSLFNTSDNCFREEYSSKELYIHFDRNNIDDIISCLPNNLLDYFF